MIRLRRFVAYGLIAAAALVASGCSSGGIGMGVPSSGGGWARYGSGTAGPDVIVGGGPRF